jgi:hypothetical protein
VPGLPQIPPAPPQLPPIPPGTPSSIGAQTITFKGTLGRVPAGFVGFGVLFFSDGILGNGKAPTPRELGPQPTMPDLGTVRITANATVTSIRLG